MDNQFLRAKSEKNKQIRMQQIMEITDRLFHEKTYHEITLTAISAESGLARGGLYKYVSSKEEIFLLIYLQKQQELLDSIMDQLQNKNRTAALLSDVISKAISRHLDFIKYHQILNAIIETNVSIEKLAEFKRKSYEQRKPLFSVLMDTCRIDEAQAYDHYLSILYHSVYLYDRVTYQDTYVKAMELAGLKIIDLDFNQNLYRFINMCLSFSLSAHDMGDAVPSSPVV